MSGPAAPGSWTGDVVPRAAEKAYAVLLQGDPEAATRLFRSSLGDEGSAAARRGLVLALLAAGRSEEALQAWQETVAADKTDTQWLQAQVDASFETGRYELAGSLARLIAQLRWASAWWPGQGAAVPARVPRDIVTVTKLRHDAEQYAYLRSRGLLGPAFDATIAQFHDLADGLARSGGVEGRSAMNDRLRSRIGAVYNRIVHLGSGDRVAAALSGAWSREEVETSFRQQGSGVVVIDDFLTPEALAGIRNFALESTVWSGIRYAHGRLGAFFGDGFNCPLLLQVADELRRALPNVITPRYPLRQIWGFKNSTDLPPESNLHADFAAVNVNFWITPDDSNADSQTGGMMIYDVDAPLGWDFQTYNGRTDIIKAFLRENGAKSLYVPYRQNRCVVFNSDLFHGTHEVRFRSGFVNHRVNVTMLYGHREQDAHHPTLSTREDLQAKWGAQQSAWRSFAFSKHRR